MNNEQFKSWLICIDDTDDIGTKGTGEIAQEIAEILSDGAHRSFITRHQLYVHPDIPYTSHNSAMCFYLETNKTLEVIKQLAVAHLLEQSAAASDPGLAILACDSQFDKEALIRFGLEAKEQVKTKKDAYDLALQLGVSLSEHGGTGQGVIGALAGIGLRLYGQDGRVKGQIDLGQERCEEGVELSVEEVLTRSGLDIVVDLSGQQLKSTEVLHLSNKVKAVYCQHQFALLVYWNEDRWCNALKRQLKEY